MSTRHGWARVRDDSGRPQFKKRLHISSNPFGKRWEIKLRQTPRCMERAVNLDSCIPCLFLSKEGERRTEDREV